MFKPMIAALIAATALVPPALAQDRGGRGDRGDRSQRSESGNQGNSNRGWGQRGGNESSAPRSNPSRAPMVSVSNSSSFIESFSLIFLIPSSCRAELSQSTSFLAFSSEGIASHMRLPVQSISISFKSGPMCALLGARTFAFGMNMFGVCSTVSPVGIV